MTEISTRRRVAAAWATLAVAMSATAQAQNQADAQKAAASTTAAVPSASEQRGDPADTRADVTRLVNRSPLLGYRPYADTEPA